LAGRNTPVTGKVGKPDVPTALCGGLSIGRKIGRRSANLLLLDLRAIRFVLAGELA
jgi:hypothetical protein